MKAHRYPVLLASLCAAWVGLILACGGGGRVPAPAPAEGEGGAAPTAGIPDDVTYTIINEETFLHFKRSLDVRLNRKVPEAVLRSIAVKLKNSDPKTYERTFIVYYLPGMEVNAGGWATSHFNPELEVRIIGSTLQKPSAPLRPDTESPALPITVTLDFKLRWTGKRVTLVGTTSLPDATRLFIAVMCINPRTKVVDGFRMPYWLGQDTTTVKDGKFSAGPCGSESGFPPGRYEVSVTMPYAFRQPEEVQRIIGPKGENLRGPLVEEDPMFGVSASAPDQYFTIK